MKNKTKQTKKAVKKTTNSPEKVAFQKLIDSYKKQNPKKYELKKEQFEKKLQSL